jgi:hypothetical protein
MLQQCLIATGTKAGEKQGEEIGEVGHGLYITDQKNPMELFNDAIIQLYNDTIRHRVK